MINEDFNSVYQEENVSTIRGNTQKEGRKGKGHGDPSALSGAGSQPPNYWVVFGVHCWHTAPGPKLLTTCSGIGGDIVANRLLATSNTFVLVFFVIVVIYLKKKKNEEEEEEEEEKKKKEKEKEKKKKENMK
ncbi:hypothetical protein MTR67_038504 [Solanum verrucosum]|uniref:Uncharacterized protein n=1 Tax=Solanum verrucosum TaxID=315347 RepID=A0AAF0UGY5_SOLVR|nr:hypothetical protein MTR67_038504 [Solanum verrucosum]